MEVIGHTSLGGREHLAHVTSRISTLELEDSYIWEILLQSKIILMCIFQFAYLFKLSQDMINM